MAAPAEHADKKLNAKARHALPSEMFADPAHEGLPLEDENHVRDAMARFNQEQFSGPSARKAAFHHIISRAHALGIDPVVFQKKYAGKLDEKDTAMDELQKKLDEAIARAEKAEKDLAGATKRADELELERDEAKRDLKAVEGRVEKAESDAKAAQEKARNDAAGDFDARVSARVALISNANAVLGLTDDKGQPVDRSKMADRDIQIAIVKHVDGDDLAEEKRAGFVEAAYEGAVRRHGKARGSRADARTAIQISRQNATKVANEWAELVGPEAEAKARMDMCDSYSPDEDDEDDAAEGDDE